MTLSSGLIVGCVGLVCFFLCLINVFDNIFNNRTALFFWKHFCISMVFLSMLILTMTMRSLIYYDGDVPLLLDFMDNIVMINITFVIAWFLYFFVITIIFYINKLDESKNELNKL